MTFLLDACDLKVVDHYLLLTFHFDRICVGDDRDKVLLCFESVEQHHLTSKELRKYISFCDDIFYHL